MDPSKSKAASGDEEPWRLDAHTLGRAITSTECWAYRGMAALFLDVVLHLKAWSSGCPCHPCHVDFLAWSRRAKTLAACDVNVRACPLQGLRAPELACGQLLKVMEELWSASAAEVATVVAKGLPGSEVAAVVRDWGKRSPGLLGLRWRETISVAVHAFARVWHCPS